MTDLFWPGAERSAEIFSDTALLDTMVRVEGAWLRVLVDRGVAPPAARTSLTALVTCDDVPALAAGAERDGNPVTALVRMLRGRADGAAAQWLHRGLTSQDVLDSALMLCVRDALTRIEEDLARQVSTLAALTDRYRDTPIAARTLTQPALPTTVGMRTARWLSGVLDAADQLATLTPVPVQIGGAAGTLAAVVELTGSPDAALTVAAELADALGLAAAAPWHTTRSFITRTGDALVGCCDAWGHIANDVVTGSRAEIGEFAEGSGGGSSTMPHKANPVLSVLIRSAALSAPPLGGALHAASAASIEERSDGGWHAEWATLRTLARRTVVAGSQTTDLLAGLRIDADRAAANLANVDGVLSEQRTMTQLAGRPAGSDYLGVTTALLDDVLQRATHYLEGIG